jgi:hypothetical protein
MVVMTGRARRRPSAEHHAGHWTNTRCFLARGDSCVLLGRPRKYRIWQGAGLGAGGLTLFRTRKVCTVVANVIAGCKSVVVGSNKRINKTTNSEEIQQ